MHKVEACPACGEATFHIAAKANDDALVKFHTFSALKYDRLLDTWLQEMELAIAECESCGHHWYRDQPDSSQLDAMYAAGRPLRGGNEPTRKPTLTMLKEMRRLRSLTPASEPRLLDYGSGFGRWARAAVQAGFSVCAYEPSRERGGEENTPFTLVHARDALQNKLFDVINLEQVLEHVPDPLQLLGEIRAHCHDESLVRITVPNILRCEEGANIWRNWPFDGQRAHVMAPFEHLHGFTPYSLQKMARRAGYAPLELSRMARHYPVSIVRSCLGRWIPKLDQTFLIVRPLRARGQ